MEAKAGIEMIDLNRVLSMVEDLSALDKNKAVKSGLRAASLAFLRGGRRRLRSRMKSPGGVTGNLLRSFSSRVKRNKLGALAGFKKMADVSGAGLTEEGGKGYHAHLVDLGTALRFTKNGAKRGVMPATMFWTDTVRMDSGKALEFLYKGIERGINHIKNRP